MTTKEAILTLNANVVIACERSGFDPATVKMIEDALSIIENALQTNIDAIPVEWLQRRRDIYLKAYHAGHESELHIAAILNDTLQAWEREKGADEDG